MLVFLLRRPFELIFDRIYGCPSLLRPVSNLLIEPLIVDRRRNLARDVVNDIIKVCGIETQFSSLRLQRLYSAVAGSAL